MASSLMAGSQLLLTLHWPILPLYAVTCSPIAFFTSKDVLHPCTYLWVGRTKMTPEKAAQLTWSQALVTRGWWEIMIGRLILNQTVTGRMMVKGSWALPLQLPTILMTLLLKLRI